METKILGVFVLSFLVSSVCAVTVTGCPTGNIQDGDEIVLTCTEMDPAFDYTWYIRKTGRWLTGETIATCTGNIVVCTTCLNGPVYTVERETDGDVWDKSTLQFVATFSEYNKAIVRCGRNVLSSTSNSTCHLLIQDPATVTTTEAPIRVSLTTSVQGGQEETAITLQRGQKNVRLTCRYDNTTGRVGLLSWCKTGSSCSKDPGSAGSSSARECPEGSRLCSTRNRTCPENIGQEKVTQSCEGSEPCGVMLTITNVRDCDGGTYSCYVFYSVDVRKYEAASVTLTVKDCEQNTYGPECSDKCGRCAGNQTCNTTTGHCPACLDGWISPRCTEAVPEAPLLTPNEKVAVGVAVGGTVSWAFMASLIQLCQILSNAGWMPFLSLGGKKEEKKKEGDDAEESSDEEEPPSKCFKFLKCILCGGAGFCLISFLCCISRGKLMSKKVRSRKKKKIQKESSASDNNMTTSVNILPDNSSSVDIAIGLPGNTSSPYSSVDRLPGNRLSPYTSVYRLPGESSSALESQSHTNLNDTQVYLYHR